MAAYQLSIRLQLVEIATNGLFRHVEPQSQVCNPGTTLLIQQFQNRSMSF
jgi:hypothetical protein